jgi:aldose 1-epimerase
VSGYPVSQVYAPENSDFICFEPMTAPIDALISGAGLNWVEPGGEFTASFTISVE